MSRGIAEEGQKRVGDALGGLGKEKHCEVRLVKLDMDKVHLLKDQAQGPGPGGDGGLLPRDMEVFVICSTYHQMTCINIGV